MDRPYPAYKGDKPYIFVSYSHKDASSVFPELVWLKDQGFNVWYDEGIEAGTEWREEIAQAINSTSLFLYFVTHDSALSGNCRKEINLADKLDIPILAIHLESTELAGSLDLTLSDRQAILKYEIPETEYQQKLQARIAAYLDQPVVQPVVVERRKNVPMLVGLVSLVLLAIGVVFYSQQGDEVATSTQPDAETSDQMKEPGIDVASLVPKGASIAVLPFVNMSSDKEQEYFSDGISEEILSVLSQIPKLHVTSRSSSFAFKGKDINLTEVARLLGVNNILEGSVRKSGDRIRITAQLINAGSDKHLWSKTFDRTLTVDNIFEIQDEIAAAIVESLRTELGLDVEVAPREKTDVSLAARNEYLKGRFFVERRIEKDVTKALAHFTRATELAPDYAPGWMGVAWAHQYLSITNYGRVAREITYQRAMPALEKALQLDPELSEAHALLGLISGTAEESAVAFEKALKLNPNNSYAIVWKANVLNRGLANAKKRHTLLEKAVALDPMSLLTNANYNGSLMSFGRFEEAEQVLQHMEQIDPNNYLVFDLYCNLRQAQNRFGEATYHCAKGNQILNQFNSMAPLAQNYDRLGLNQLATHVFDGTDYELIGQLYTSNPDFLRWARDARARFPRSDSDVLDAFIRAYAEYSLENYIDAVKYFQLSRFVCRDCSELIFSYLQVGEIESANKLLEQRKQQFQDSLDAGIQSFGGPTGGGGIEINAIDLALLDSDLPEALKNLKLAVSKGFIIYRKYKRDPLYQPLWDHPDWSSLIAVSDKHAAEQREIYLRLVAEDTQMVQ